MAGPNLLQQAIEDLEAVVTVLPEAHRQEAQLLIKDLEDARKTVFVRTVEGRSMVEKCAASARVLRQIIDRRGWRWNDETAASFTELEQAVRKLRNTILVRTQRAT